MAVATTCTTYEPHASDYIVIRDGHAEIETRFSRVRLATLACAGLSDDVLRRMIASGGFTTKEVGKLLDGRGE